MTTQTIYKSNEIIAEANAIIRDAKYTKLVKAHRAGKCQLVMAGPDFNIYISPTSYQVYASFGVNVYRLK
jgi:hypothetical protein